MITIVIDNKLTILLIALGERKPPRQILSMVPDKNEDPISIVFSERELTFSRSL